MKTVLDKRRLKTKEQRLQFCVSRLHFKDVRSVNDQISNVDLILYRETMYLQSNNSSTTTNQHFLICSWQSGTAVKMPSVLVKQLLTD